MLAYAHYFTETRADVSQSIPRWRNWFGTAVLRIVVSSGSKKKQLRPATVKAAQPAFFTGGGDRVSSRINGGISSRGGAPAWQPCVRRSVHHARPFFECNCHLTLGVLDG